MPVNFKLRERDEEEQKAHILNLLEKNNWNKSGAARELDMTYRGLHKKLTKWGIKRPGALAGRKFYSL